MDRRFPLMVASIQPGEDAYDRRSTFRMAIRSGTCPAPSSAINGFRLAGPDGSHPLHRVAIPEL